MSRNDYLRRIAALVGEPQHGSEVRLSRYNRNNGGHLCGRFTLAGRNTLSLSLSGLSLAQALAIAGALKLPAPLPGQAYAVFFARTPTFCDSGRHGTTRLVTSDIPHTHAFVTTCRANDLDDVYRRMQAEQWSPNGEAAPVIAAAGVGHTSLSIGDLVCDPNGRFWECVSAGWRRVEIDQPLGDCPHCGHLRAQGGDYCPHCGAQSN